MQVQSNDTLLHCDSTMTTTTATSLLSPPLTPTSDGQSMSEDLPWSVEKQATKPLTYDHYTAMSPPEFNSRKGRNKALIRYHQAMVQPDVDDEYPPTAKAELIHCNQFITQCRSNQPLKATRNHRKMIKPRRSIQRDEKSDQRIFQLRVYDTSPTTLLQCSSRIIQPPIVKSDLVDQSQYSDEEQAAASAAQFKRSRALSDASEATSKKCKSDAAMAFDRVNIEESDHDFFDPQWIPSYQVFDQRLVRVVWKGKEIISVFLLCNLLWGDTHCNFPLPHFARGPKTSLHTSLFLCVPPKIFIQK